MQPQVWMRMIKIHLLLNSLLVTILGVAVIVMTLWTGRDARFTAVRSIAVENNNYTTIHSAVLYTALALSAFLIVAGVLCASGLIRESERLLAAGFIILALLFCVAVQLGYWMFTRAGEVEGAVMDVYDFLYHDFLRNQSDSAGQHLTAFHTAFSCCGKRSHSPLTGPVESITCPAGLRATGQGCLLAVSASLQKHMDWCWALLLLMMAAVVSGMILTSFLYFSIRLGVSGERQGKYTLAGR
ncbi:tetraspanin-32-like [Acipenser oxyrinchus oxyrinchus]|uniref:Tetraspanin n=1 Tax=Acipenser oxyrinchus oxyrinchus TaxID=40147 RepID=A0AAD8D403_ACIOX|nr:tetraspanin-32-like [Acipenser oxyrinchus oxyrinchus]